MKLITRDTDYAIRALCYSANCPDKKITVSRIVKELKIPRPFLRKIVQVLNKKGILKSYKGKDGGFELAVSPAKVFLTDVIEIFQGPLKLNECLFKSKICPRIDLCPLSKKLDEIEKYAFKELKGINIAFLIKSGGFINGKKKNNKDR